MTWSRLVPNCPVCGLGLERGEQGYWLGAYFFNLMAMETEEMIRAQPMDSVILIGGCDKTLPAQIMAAASSDIPAIFLPTGPMAVGDHRGERLGACTDCRRYWAMFRAGEIDDDEAVQEMASRLATLADAWRAARAHVDAVA